MEAYFNSRHIREDDRFPFAISQLSGDVSSCIMSLTGHLSGFKQSAWEWDWAKLKQALILMDGKPEQSPLEIPG